MKNIAPRDDWRDKEKGRLRLHVHMSVSESIIKKENGTVICCDTQLDPTASEKRSDSKDKGGHDDKRMNEQKSDEEGETEPQAIINRFEFSDIGTHEDVSGYVNQQPEQVTSNDDPLREPSGQSIPPDNTA